MSDRIRSVALLVAVGVLLLHTARLQPWTVDDAYIALRYAGNWGAGLGPVYNPGEAVEGFTSVGWVGLLAVLAALGVPLEPTAKVLGVASAIGILAVLSRLGSPRAGAISVLLASSSGPLTAWAASGMEVVPGACVLLLVGIVGAQLAEAPKPAAAFRFGLAVAFAAVVRPESALLLPALAGGLAVGGRPKEALLVALGAALGYAPVEAWRVATYGWLLPNTAYAKVGGTAAGVVRGLEALRSAAPALGPLALVACAGLAARPRVVAVVLGWAALHVAGFVVVGGDALPGYRLLVPIVAPLAACAGLGLDALATRWRWAPLLAAPALAAGLAASAWDPELTTRIENGHVGRNGREVGHWLRDTYGAEAVVASNTAGSVAWFSGLVTIDMLGLCDAHIAHRRMPAMGTRKAGHEKADGAYVLGRRPDVVLFGGARGRRDPFFLSDQELWALPAFRAGYRYEEHVLPSGAMVHLYVRVER